jgi:hypothetical protein
LNIVLAVIFAVAIVGLVLYASVSAKFLESRFGLNARKTRLALALFGVLMLSIVQTFAQSFDIDLDLTGFFDTLSTIFNQLFPVFVIVAAIPAAIGLIFILINALKGAFKTGGRA